jgi:hypothetical protein
LKKASSQAAACAECKIDEGQNIICPTDRDEEMKGDASPRRAAFLGGACWFSGHVCDRTQIDRKRQIVREQDLESL